LCFVLCHEKCLLDHCPRYPPFCGAEPNREGDSKKRLHTHDANGYQATSSDRCFVYVSSVSRMVWKVSVLKHRVLYDTLVLGSWRIRGNSIHRCAQKGNSQKGNSATFVITEFSEVRTLSWCYGAHTALEHILFANTGVCCLRCVATRGHVKAQDSYLLLF
jgi:hypothetical protein